MKKVMLVSTLIGLTLSSLAQAATILGEAQFNSGDVLPSPIIAVSNDLLQTSLFSATNEQYPLVRNGTTGTAFTDTAQDPARVYWETPTTYNLDVSVNTLGYDITEIRLFSGWNGFRPGQNYEILYSLVGDAAFTSLGTVTELRDDGALLTRTYDSLGAFILTGVDAIQFAQPTIIGTVFREFDVIGVAHIPEIPEPSSLAMLGLGAVGFYRVARRRRT